MEAFKLPVIGTLFCYAKNGNRIFWNSGCSVIYLILPYFTKQKSLPIKMPVKK